MLSVLRLSTRGVATFRPLVVSRLPLTSSKITLYNISKRGLAEVRFVSAAPSVTSSAPVIDEKLLDTNISDVQIPDVPPVPEPGVMQITAEEILAQPSLVNALGEPSLQSMGLGSWYPTGMVQQGLEFLHVSLDMPWWSCIVAGTVFLKLLLFPLIIKNQKNNANMNNTLPELQAIQMKMTKARQTGNHYESARYGHEMLEFMKEKKLNPMKSMLVPLAQAPVFLSCFIGLRAMANYPIESMTVGGISWFTDLTVPDQFYILPVLTSLTLFLTIQLGTDGAKMSTQGLSLMKYFLKALPVIIFPFIINFPSAILCYWLTSNGMSLIQVAILKIPTVRDILKIPRLVKHSPDALPQKKKGFVAGAKDAWTNFRLSREVGDRVHADELVFNKAGKGPLKKTYKIDPTKIAQGIISAKQKQY